MADAARELRLAPNTVSTLVGRLTAAGLLDRTRAPSDGRSVRLTVTAAGPSASPSGATCGPSWPAGPGPADPAADRQALADAVPALLRLAAQLEEDRDPLFLASEIASRTVHWAEVPVWGAVAVDGVDLGIRPGEMFGLLGPNGAGKTTTIRMLVTLLKPPAGQRERVRRGRAARPMLVRRMIGSCPAAVRGREPDRPGERELFARLFDVPRAAGRAGDEALTAMGLADAAERLVETYSGGMIRRLELAQALVNAPRLLILDEPTVGLDPIARTDVWEFITSLRAATE